MAKHQIRVNNAILSYPHLFTPRAIDAGSRPKYSATLWIPKADAALIQAVNAAIQGVIAEKWGADPTQHPALKPASFFDGALQIPGKKAPDPKAANFFIMAASNHSQPGLVDANVQPIMQESVLYPGCVVNAVINAYPYDRPTAKGVAFGLEAVQFVSDGERLDDRPDPSTMFSQVGGAPAGGGGFDPLG